MQTLGDHLTLMFPPMLTRPPIEYGGPAVVAVETATVVEVAAAVAAVVVVQGEVGALKLRWCASRLGRVHATLHSKIIQPHILIKPLSLHSNLSSRT